MARRVYDFTVDLTKPMKIQSLGSIMGLGDKEADAIDIKLVSDGGPLYVYDGSVRGRVVRPDGKTYIFDATNPIAQHYMITLPAEAYEVPGTITISAVYSKADAYDTTLLILTAYVHRTVTSDVVDLNDE